MVCGMGTNGKSIATTLFKPICGEVSSLKRSCGHIAMQGFRQDWAASVFKAEARLQEGLFVLQLTLSSIPSPTSPFPRWSVLWPKTPRNGAEVPDSTFATPPGYHGTCARLTRI